MFTVAAVSTNVAALPIGTILDRYGPRVCGIIGSVLLFIGAVLFSFASQIPGDGYTPGYFFLALGGPVCLYLLLPVVEYLPPEVWTDPSPSDWRLRLIISSFPYLQASIPSHRRQAQYSEAVPRLSGGSCLHPHCPAIRHAQEFLQVGQRSHQRRRS